LGFRWSVERRLTSAPVASPQVISTILFVLFRRNLPSGAGTYAWALRGTILSYAIVIQKAHLSAYFRSLGSGAPRSLRQVAEGLMRDESVQYVSLAFTWYFNRPYTREYQTRETRGLSSSLFTGEKMDRGSSEAP
jgi:hypothetical protein